MVVRLFSENKSFLYIEISGQTLINNTWKEIKLPTPFKPERKVQNVCVEFLESYEPDYKEWKLKMSNNVPITLEIQTIDENGNKFEVDRLVRLDERTMCYKVAERDSLDDSLPRDREHKAIKIRSDYSLNISKIYWLTYNPEDRK